MDLDDLLALLPDNNTGAIDAVDLRTIVTELWNRGAGIEARVATLETEGANTQPVVTGRWQTNPQAGATPGGMQVTAESGEWALATWLRFAKTDQNNNDLTTVLMNATQIYGQQQSDSSNWGRWTVDGDITDGGSYVEIPVGDYRGGGSIATAGWQHAIMAFEVQP